MVVVILGDRVRVMEVLLLFSHRPPPPPQARRLNFLNSFFATVIQIHILCILMRKSLIECNVIVF